MRRGPLEESSGFPPKYLLEGLVVLGLRIEKLGRSGIGPPTGQSDVGPPMISFYGWALDYCGMILRHGYWILMCCRKDKMIHLSY